MSETRSVYRLICEGACTGVVALARANKVAECAALAYRKPRLAQKGGSVVAVTAALRACALTVHTMATESVAVCDVCGARRTYG